MRVTGLQTARHARRHIEHVQPGFVACPHNLGAAMTWARVHAQEEIASLLPRLEGNTHQLNDLSQDLLVDPTALLSKTLHAGVRLGVDLLRITSRENSLTAHYDLR